ncbi:riboflavin biosynthesis protein RibD [Lactobacillus nasalidis]|uniref:bifunctional diaminohydroxyphosphoribosylaminopyrimidine deaminase/5-amino-6-(5-phosphoribosylamino)uracil reductase RibD n=3 Tax=Lactobacillus nasalidis TaxID=2797258 RepID=UPI001915F97F|nr:bifunctional diaminohydroxyphosphoribosylaminopyrimidine deaminase/5-amino-6-(5-phosphoribosylamino)uracil reductase RibD [Lactobacillus nasalidis]GHV98446.1 riboflavin biosynthesis protein RibD [Lactobacillus nasalidis]
MASDEDYMRLAIAAARKAGNATWRNPRVGCCIVKDGQVLATGFHHRYGGFHAERDTISKLTPEQLSNSTIYVTLEPCCHYGKQPPCSQLIIDSGIKRVVVGETDPHAIVTGKGIAALKQAGLEVRTGLLAKEASRLNDHYNYFYQTGLPYITLKQAVSLDHMLAKKGERTAVTGAEALSRVHQERADYQAILIGSETAIIDDPSLLTSEDLDHPPVRVVLDRRGRLLDHLDLDLFSDGRAETWILTENPAFLKQAFPDHVRIFALPDGKIRTSVKILADQGVQSIYAEGGAKLQESLLEAGLVNDVITYLAPRFLGRGTEAAVPAEALDLKEVKTEPAGEDVRIYGRIKDV